VCSWAAWRPQWCALPRRPSCWSHGAPAWRAGRATRVLVPLDGSGLGAAILPVAERLAGPLDLELHLLRAVEPGADDALDAVEAGRYLGGVAGRLEARGLRVRVAVRAGRAVDVIPAHVGEHGIGLVAMSTRARAGLGRLLFGSVAEQVLSAVTVPVLRWRPARPVPE
jgi:nucleotide-binding universal stress UspA family protein